MTALRRRDDSKDSAVAQPGGRVGYSGTRAYSEAMHAVQLFLPLYDNGGQPFPRTDFARVRDQLTERFGGVTAHTRAPARGQWKDDEDGKTVRDDVVVYEVMVAELDRAWWAKSREQLRETFRQDELLVRAWVVERL